MPLLRSDYDQAIRYLKGASDTLERTAAVQSRGLRELLAQLVNRLTPGNRLVAQLAGDITMMKQAAARAKELGQADAGTEILKAAAVLRDRSR